MVEDRLVDNAARQGARLLDGLWDLVERLAAITNPRGRGCLLAFDLPDTETRNAIRTELWQAGLATLACGSRAIRLRPPLVIGGAEVDLALERLEQVLAARHARA
jgi:4-aminobutyrate aminotransferase-like enzyme